MIEDNEEKPNNFEKKESFNQIRPSNPFRRNMSQLMSSPNVKESDSNKCLYPTLQQKTIQSSNNNQAIKKLTHSQSAANIKGGFNPLFHIPPKYDIYGHLMPLEKRLADMSILDNKDNIKIPWNTKNTNKSGAMTRTELLELRRKEKLPDISYDLDKDGYVGGRDLVLSKRFDIDKDGKLNEKEKKEALEGLANKIEDQYLWNVDNQNQGGSQKYRFRILQKRGKIINAEDFLPIRDTYPVHPLTKVVPHVATFTELKQLRKEQNIKQINKLLADYENKNPSKLIYYYSNNNSNSFNDNEGDNVKPPLYSSKQQIKDAKIKKARIKCGLDPEFIDCRDLKNHPGLEYIYSPIHKTKSEIKAAYRKENLEKSKKLNNIKHKSDLDRLNERENEIFAKIYTDKEGLTYSKIKDQKRKETNEYNIKTFSHQALGVHGHELPKYSESEKNKEFWKLKEGYCENPKFKSQCEYLESIKYYKPPGEELLLNEHRDEDPNWVDPFKKVHILEAKYKKENLITKINNINIFKNFDPNNPRPVNLNKKYNHVYRWTTLVDRFAPNKFKKGRFFDSLPEEGEKHTDGEKLKNNKVIFGRHKDGKNRSQSVNGKEIGNNKEMGILSKDSLFQKYSAREQNKNSLPKNTMARTKGF